MGRTRRQRSSQGGDVEQGRDAFGRRAWAEAHAALSQADRAVALGLEDLERLALAAYLVGRDDEYLEVLERAYRGAADAGEGERAARCAFWLGLRLVFRGEIGRASGWFARAQRVIEGRDCVEQGYLQIPNAEGQLAAGQLEAAYASAASAAGVGDRFGDGDLVACARHLQGRICIRQERIAEGLAFLDETMVAVTARELSPLLTGLLYCSVIQACQEAHALGRAREWTSTLARWCDEQVELVAFTGVCRVHRAEIMQLHGAWGTAMDEAIRAVERSQGVNRQATAAALYRQGELHRLRGELAAAEEAYRRASQEGCEPQPGLALLRLAQGRVAAATAAIRRVVGATTNRFARSRLLAAHAEIVLAAGELDEARASCAELDALATCLDADVLRAATSYTCGAIELAAGNAQAALGLLRQAQQLWQSLDVPYEVARTRTLLGACCRALGDAEGSALELDAARVAFAALGAASDIARLDAPSQREARHGLTARELQVLRLVALGKTNKAIAAQLFLSEKTIDRHLSNIFSKLEVSSRAAATAYAYQHELL
jgi:DNA-binding CsgD family transcriptional regulator